MSFANSSELFRHKAEEARRYAETMTGNDEREALLAIADAYERVASRIAARSPVETELRGQNSGGQTAKRG
jgi:hypothetical protein